MILEETCADGFVNAFHFHTATLWVFREEGAVVGIWFLSVCRPSKLPCKPQTFRFHTVDGNKKSGDQQLRLVVSPIIYKVLAPSQVVIAGFLNHHYQTSGRFVQICRWEKCSFIMCKDSGNLWCQHHLLSSIPRIFMNPR